MKQTHTRTATVTGVREQNLKKVKTLARSYFLPQTRKEKSETKSIVDRLDQDGIHLKKINDFIELKRNFLC